MRIDEIESIFSFFLREWQNLSREIKLSNKSLYNLITLKKTFENKHYAIQETVIAIMKSNGAVENESGELQVPEENISKVNKELMDLGNQNDKIEGDEIIIRDEDFIPSQLMEILYDFIVIE